MAEKGPAQAKTTMTTAAAAITPSSAQKHASSPQAMASSASKPASKKTASKDPSATSSHRQGPQAKGQSPKTPTSPSSSAAKKVQDGKAKLRPPTPTPTSPLCSTKDKDPEEEPPRIQQARPYPPANNPRAEAQSSLSAAGTAGATGHLWRRLYSMESDSDSGDDGDVDDAGYDSDGFDPEMRYGTATRDGWL